jgi:hypothetical protein
MNVVNPPQAVNILCWIELVFLSILGVEMVIYNDFGKGR